MPRQSWKPRHGKPLMEKPQRGWLEHQSAFIAKRVPTFFLDPRWGILIGACITFVGRAELQLRSIGILLMAVWLIVDLWAWILRRRVEPRRQRFWHSVKFMVGWTATSVLLVAVMLTMLWGIGQKLDDQQSSVYQKLTATVELPPSGDPVESFFTIKNGSEVDISDDDTVCRINFASYDSGNVQSNTKDFLLGRPKAPLLAGDDGKSDFCAALRSEPDKLTCADVTWEYHYTISTQPQVWKSKPFRFATYKFGDRFLWHSEPTSETRSPCATRFPDVSQYTKVTVCLEQGCTYHALQTALDSVSCGTIIYYDRFEPLGSGNAGRFHCTELRRLMMIGSDNPRRQVQPPVTHW
jgi:hypothetical protein